MKRLTKKDLINLANRDIHNFAVTSKIVSSFFNVTKKLLQEDKAVRLRSVGVLSPYVDKSGREVRNPKTKEKMQLPIIRTVRLYSKFKESKRADYAEVLHSQLIIHIAADCAMPPEYIEIVLSKTIGVIRNLKHGDSIEIRCFGTFEGRKAVTRHVRNPQTGESLGARDYESIGFRAGKTLRKRLKAIS